MRSEDSAPNDNDVVQKFTRIRPEPQGTVLEVLEISWKGPHTPVSDWTEVKRCPSDVEGNERERWHLLQNLQFFRVCQECLKRRPVGGMHDQDICQSCAEANHQVVY